MAELQEAAEKFGLSAMAVETTLENLETRERPFACIGHIKSGHFVLLTDISNDQVTVADPPRIMDVPTDQFTGLWSNKCLLISATPLATEESIGQLVFRRFLMRILAWSALTLISIVGVFVFVRRKWSSQ